MSFLRMILLAAYLAGVTAMVFGVAIRFELIAMMGLPARGALTFAIGCFLCVLVTREVAAILERPKEQPQVEQAKARAAGDWAQEPSTVGGPRLTALAEFYKGEQLRVAFAEFAACDA